MAWAKLDDHFAEHPKVAALSDRAFRIHVTAICYAARHRTDGALPAGLATRWTTRRIVGELVAAGVWDEDGSGYLIHDFLIYNPTRAEQDRRAEERAKAGRSGGLAKAKAGANKRRAKPEPEPPPDEDPGEILPRTPYPGPPGVGVDSDPDTPIAEGNIADAVMPNGKGKGGEPFHLADVVNLGLVISLRDRYRRRGWNKTLTEGLLTGLVLGSESKHLPACGARAVNGAIDDLYANAATVKDPAGYLRDRAAELSRSESP